MTEANEEKRVMLKISNATPYPDVRSKPEAKFKAAATVTE